MNKIILFLLVLATTIGCKTDFSVNGEYEETPIVHMLLDPHDEFHFLKLNKTFLGDGNANTFASVPDSSYFDKVDAKVEEVINGNVTRTWELYDTLIENKEPGNFYYPQQKLYCFKADDLNEDATYRLDIEIDNGRHVITGETKLVQGMNISFPNVNQQLGFAESDVPKNGYRTQSISFSQGTGDIFNGKIRFDYIETTDSGNEKKSILWDLGSISKEDITVSTPSFAAGGELFYELVGNTIEVNDAVTRRTPYAFELIITGGSEDLNTYILVNEPTSSLAQNKPTFSNITGGLGIFSARTTVTQFKYVQNPSNPNVRALSVNSTKELCKGQYTGTLKFCSNHVNDIAQGYDFACN